MHCLTALEAVGNATPAMHCLTAWAHWAVQLLQYIASLPRDSGQCKSYNALPHYPGTVYSANPAMDRLTALGAVGSASPAMHYPSVVGCGQWNSCNALPPCPGVVGSATPAMHCLTAWGRGQWNSCNLLPHRLGAVGSVTRGMHCRNACGQRAAELLQCIASLPGGTRQCNLCNALPPGGGAEKNPPRR